MDPPITHREIVEAVDVAARGIGGKNIVTHDEWDRILPTLIAAHTLCGGTTRHLVDQVFAATYATANDVAEALSELHHILTPPVRGTRPRARSKPNQPCLF